MKLLKRRYKVKMINNPKINVPIVISGVIISILLFEKFSLCEKIALLLENIVSNF